MKRCPTCDRTFEDNLRFCQSDGTPLVDDAPVDPYKTMVARPEDMASAKDDEVLQIPDEPDPRRTMIASEDEIRREMDKHDAGEETLIDIPPLGAAPEPPKFKEPDVAPPSFGSPPPSPFSSDPDPFSKTSPPIPSPFGEPEQERYEPPPAPDFKPYPEAERPFGDQFGQDRPTAPTEWPAPPTPAGSWQNQDLAPNASFQPTMVGGTKNQTLAIVSLVLGILSIVCCGVFTAVPALITGWMAKNKAEQNPSEFGGRGMALAGMITGGIGLVLGILAIIYYIVIFSQAAF